MLGEAAARSSNFSALQLWLRALVVTAEQEHDAILLNSEEHAEQQGAPSHAELVEPSTELATPMVAAHVDPVDRQTTFNGPRHDVASGIRLMRKPPLKRRTRERRFCTALHCTGSGERRLAALLLPKRGRDERI